MWALDNRTPYQSERTWVRASDGAYHWVVVVKATYHIASDGKLTLSETPLLPLRMPEYQGKEGESSLRYEADLVAMKPSTDVYLNAVAFAPHGRAGVEVNVSVRLGQLYKELRVRGERVWERSLLGSLRPSAPQPFTALAITYERAFGGLDQTNPDPRQQRIDFRNPVGSGIAAEPRHLLGKPAPSIEYLDRQPGDGLPAGLGALASFWSPRRELAGTYDDQWLANRRPLLPEDYDPRFLCCAPLDQQPGVYLGGGELVELVNLTASGRLRFALPAVELRCETFFGSLRKEHRAELVSVIVDSSEPRLILVWQSSLRCGNDVDYLDKTVIKG